jgi:hypothetical protein
MIRTERFLISKRPYAIALDRMVTQERPANGLAPSYWSIQLQAVWFRRRSGVLAACLGYLWDHQDSRPASPQEAAQLHADGRYGGHCQARLDATGYWADGGAPPDVIKRHLEVLEPMLAAVGEVPEGYDGWWHF